VQSSDGDSLTLLPAEKKLWLSNPRSSQVSSVDEYSDLGIGEKYNSRQSRVLTEINRERLPIFSQSLQSARGKRIELQPTYQRRKRWNATKKSRLIESFLANIPVPPVILYEVDYDKYEVMDGQQRITAIHEFYTNQLTLMGLELWPELNGRRYDDLPLIIRSGIDRRAISSIVIIAESTADSEEAMFLKRITFERINTGGVDLSAQEVRNCLYQSEFNQLLIELSENEQFKRSLGIKNDNESVYQKMEDVELVLRFFALRSLDYFKGNLKSFLTAYMIKMKENSLSSEEKDSLTAVFNQTITLACNLYGEKPFQPPSQDYKKAFYKAYYDAVMVGLSHNLQHSSQLLNCKDRVLDETQNLFCQPDSDIFKGKGKDNREGIGERISRFDTLIKNVLTS
jgi:hypothetical protein